MPKFKLTPAVEGTITHEVETATAEHANAIDDRWTEPVLVDGA